MKTSDFDYTLPQALIAQTPIEPRDRSRLMVLDRRSGTIEHRRFFEITEYLREGDVVVCNDSRVIPARLKGKKNSGGKVEMLLLQRREPGVWEALVKPARRLQTGARVQIDHDLAPAGGDGAGLTAEIMEVGQGGVRVVRFSSESGLSAAGEVALPPYIHTPLANAGRYQTIYAKADGSVAAPTAGLHFTPELLGEIQGRGVRLLFTTLHVGLDTFRPVKEADPRDHAIHREYGVLDGEVAAELTRARESGQRVVCIGTTTARLLEQAATASQGPRVNAFQGWVDLFILPGHRFRAIDALVTNFHLPRSTLLMLVSAFAGKDLIDRAYREAIELGYRFYSFGDAMLVL